jgi:alpha-amylase/alpha-mannosidase (GH57 family)
MKWVNFLHFYQPVNMDAHVIEEATEKSYLRVVRALEEHPQIKFTININGSLLLRWEDLGYQNLIERINVLLKKKQIEITGTACYHPLLPLIPEKEARRQIRENEDILKRFFGKNFKPKGFFLPEMAYSPQVARLVKRLGYKWIILDEIAFSGKLGEADCTKVYQDKNSSLKVVLRDNVASNKYVPNLVRDILDKKEKERDILLTATDGELYGLRHIDHTAEFEKVLKRKELKTLLISEFIAKQKVSEIIKIHEHSWATTEKEYRLKQPFNLWHNKKNKVHNKLWELAYLVYDIIENNTRDKNYYWARWHLVRGFASCTFWWASARDFELFGNLSWSPDEIERGLNELIRAVRALDSHKTRADKIKAEKIYISIKKIIWEKHWNYYWKNN